nr:sensory transduction histidine kinase [uncultured bacterium]
MGERQTQQERGDHQIQRLSDDLDNAKRGLRDAGTRIDARQHCGAAHIEQIESEKDLLERIIRNVPAGIAFLDRDLRYRWVNPAYATLLGSQPEAIVGRSIFEVLADAETQLGPMLRGVLESGRPFVGEEYPFTRRVGDTVQTTYWDFSCVPILDAAGEVEGLLVLDVDISERAEQARHSRRQIEQLQDLDRMKDEFLSVISHELRTPLNFIAGFAALLQDEAAGPLNASQHDFVRKIINGSDRMLALVNDLLDVAKIKAGKLELNPVPTPYAPLVDEVLESMLPLAAERGLSLAQDVDVPGLPCLDGPRIVQVLANLVSNAIKFTEPGGTITLRAFVSGDQLVTQLTDTGCGIPAEDQAQLFTRFKQLDMSTTRKAGGTGLGLAITKALVEAHGGRVGVISEPGSGSTFWFSIPLVGQACRLEAEPI